MILERLEEGSMEIKGIDVSTWQGDIDWAEVAGQGIQFAILRASFGEEGVDRKFEQNIQQAPAAGIACGAYHYCYATSTQAAQKEAEHFLEVIKPYQFPYPVALDLEDTAIAALGKNTATDIAQTFLETVKNAGYYVVLYSNLNWLVNYLDMQRLSSYDVWLAQWSSKPTYQGDFGIWQYTSEGEISGIDAPVDRDLCYKEYPSLIQSSGLNGFQQGGEGQPAPKPEKKTYTVKKGDSLSGIAQKFGISLQALLDANPQISDPSLIYAGQVLTIPDSAGGGQQQPRPEIGTYTVQSGDSMSAIAQKLGVSLQALLDANTQISDPNLIYTGQVLVIPKQGDGNHSPSQKPEQKEYTVQKGDTLGAIAQRFGVGLPSLLQANPEITNPNVIYIGQRITLPGTGPSHNTQSQKYTVKPGDTLSGIAQKFGVGLQSLRQANPQVSDPNMIYPGQVLTVPAR